MGPGVKLLFVGIIRTWTSATADPFRASGQPVLSALRLAGILGRDLDRAEGMTDDDRAYLLGRGIGISNLVNRATTRADELSAGELRAGPARLEALVQWKPRVVAVAGVTAFRTAFLQPRARLGRQPDDLAGAELWVVPNPSGLNAHETIPQSRCRLPRTGPRGWCDRVANRRWL